MRLQAAFLLLLAAACGSSGPARNTLPSFVAGTPQTTTYDGNTDDLLTAGLGKTGLAGASPSVAAPTSPTAAELRRLAIYNNYRALVDITAAGGYGSLYGPNVDVNGVATASEGKIAGDETLAFADDGTGKLNVTLAVQVPSTFDKTQPCIVTATSSGSRGVYGAIATAGEWGLKHGCAVAYVDKGTGTGAHDLQNNTVNTITGVRADAVQAGKASNFTAALSASELAAFNTATPNRFAFKHAHSQQNPEKDWGTNTLQAIQFAYWVLNEKFGAVDSSGAHVQTIQPGRALVIASSVSNGGGAALAAAEQDTIGLISGVVAGEPQVQIPATAGVIIQRGGIALAGTGKTLFDYTTAGNLYQPCAALSDEATAASGMGSSLISNPTASARCAALQQKGLLTATNTHDQAEESLQRLRAAGYGPESDILHASIWALATPPVAVTYANAYARASVKDNLCGFSFGATDATGAPAPLAPSAEAQIFGTSNGIPPTSGVNIINNNSLGGPLRDPASISPSTGQKDYNVDGAVCLRELQTGTDPAGAALTGSLLAASQAVQTNVAQVLRSGDLHGKPAILVQGRNDTLVPVNHASRAYFGLNQKKEGAGSKLVYYEVDNAQHFDGFIGSPALPGYATRYVPLHRYFINAMDLMYANLKSGAALPPSQLVHTLPRGGSPGNAPAITAANVPPIVAAPAAGDRITFAGSTVTVPQ